MYLREEIIKAHILANKAHGDQVDKAGESYLFHVFRVASDAMNYEVTDQYVKTQLYVVGLLHDVVEDSEVTKEELESDFGHAIAEAVDAITHRQNETYVEYLQRVKKNKLATGAKLADLRDNSDFHRFIKLAKIDHDAFTRVVEVLIPRYIRAYELLTRAEE